MLIKVIITKTSVKKYLDIKSETLCVPKENKNLEQLYHITVKKVTEDYENLKFNTAISSLMIFMNAVSKEEYISTLFVYSSRRSSFVNDIALSFSISSVKLKQF